MNIILATYNTNPKQKLVLLEDGLLFWTANDDKIKFEAKYLDMYYYGPDSSIIEWRLDDLEKYTGKMPRKWKT